MVFNHARGVAGAAGEHLRHAHGHQSAKANNAKFGVRELGVPVMNCNRTKAKNNNKHVSGNASGYMRLHGESK